MATLNGAETGGASSGTPLTLEQLRAELGDFRRSLLKQLLDSLQANGAVSGAPVLDGAVPDTKTPDSAPRLPRASTGENSLVARTEASESSLGALSKLQELDDEDVNLLQDPEWKQRRQHEAQTALDPQQLLDRFVCQSGASESGKRKNAKDAKDDDGPSRFQLLKAKVVKCEGAFSQLGQTKRDDLAEEEYSVESLYSDTGILQMVARSHIFEKVSLFVIVVNAIYIGVDVNFNGNSDEPPALGFVVFDQLFCVFFTGEILIRFGAFHNKCDCLRDKWFRFDSALVTLMVAETWLMPLVFPNSEDLPTAPLRLLRLFRLARLIRLLRAFPELITMLKGMWVASRAVLSSLFLLLIIVYVFGIIVHMVLSSDKSMANRFETLPMCMWTLMMDGILLDSTGDVFAAFFQIEDAFKGFISTFIMMGFIGLCAITITNMLVGVLCEVVSTVAQNERDDSAISLMKNSILQELKRFDTNNNGSISKNELDSVMRSEAALEALGSLDIDVECLHELQQALFINSEVSIERIMELLLSYRGNLTCTVKHLLDAQVFTRWSFSEQIHNMKAHLDEKFQELAQVLAMLIQRVLHGESLADGVMLRTRKMHDEVLGALSECFPQSNLKAKRLRNAAETSTSNGAPGARQAPKPAPSGAADATGGARGKFASNSPVISEVSVKDTL